MTYEYDGYNSYSLSYQIINRVTLHSFVVNADASFVVA